MNNRELSRQIQILNNLFNKTKAINELNDIDLQEHWGKYLCVLTAGFLEIALTEVYAEFCTKKTNVYIPHVASFARKSLKRIQSPKAGTFIDVARSFDNTWGSDLEIYIEDNGRKEAINNIIANRHLIAHGKNSDISIVRLKDYFNKAVEVIEYIESQCNRTSEQGNKIILQ